MAIGRKYTIHKKILERHKLKQLDVYRYPDHDEIRLKMANGRVVLVRLSKRREEYSPEEFEREVLNALKGARS